MRHSHGAQYIVKDELKPQELVKIFQDCYSSMTRKEREHQDELIRRLVKSVRGMGVQAAKIVLVRLAMRT